MYGKQNNTTEEKQSTQAGVQPVVNPQILASNLVYPTREGFIVTAQGKNGLPMDYRVTRNLRQSLVCVCKTFLDESIGNPQFMCEHLLAVDAYLFEKLYALKNKPAVETPIKWLCHHRTRVFIEDLMNKITTHPEGKPMAELRAAIQKEIGNKNAPEGCFQESAERTEKFLREWWTNLCSEAPDEDRAAA